MGSGCDDENCSLAENCLNQECHWEEPVFGLIELECCTFCTILHITFLSLERYVAVCWPITAKTLVTRRRTRTLIGCLWLGAAVSAAPVLVMVGVEDVEGEELVLSGWREGGGLTGVEGDQAGFMIGGMDRESGHITSMDGGLEGIHWGEQEKNGWGEGIGELKWFGESTTEEGDEKQGADGGGEEEGKRQNKMREDEGGGMEEGVDGGHGIKIDRRECRCTQYAISSGLLSAMMILSNMYFLVPLCILGLVYSLIGRTLWLRPRSSRRDQSHRQTVKMLGVIVLAFVLCWLPFHVGRTIFSLSLGYGSDRQETSTDANSRLDNYTLSDVSTDTNINTDTATKPVIHSDSETHFKTTSKTGKMTAHFHGERDQMFCDICANKKVNINTHADVDTHLAESHHMSTHKHFYSHVISQHISTSTNTHKLNPSTDTDTHNVTAHGDTQLSATPTDLYSDNTHNDTYTPPDAHMYFMYYLSQYFNLVSSVLFYLSAAVNPLLYNLMSARYRHAVHSLVHKRSDTHSHRLHTLTARHSTTTL
ncbi:Growth hormone secretagogue receptor type 1 [Collichthys lucidus]|uniref:Growth hormone secretagogue receptor type 1 n=1 Tax=Collichthys lucidus TaxID=240159 RepID=A0A4U5VUJ9_COLLU|nr:Growth hormone secretagogue receptor type 1 [Collichthys lucidus]